MSLVSVSRARMVRRLALVGGAALLVTTSLIAPRPTAAASLTLTGAGSTFVFPFFNKAFYVYSGKHPDVKVNYQAIGSGGGIQQFTKGTVDFGASDVPMNAAELKAAVAAGGPVIQFPVALGATAVAINVPGVMSGQLKLTPAALAGIYLGKITSWDDAAIANANQGLTLPKLPIAVVHRSDGSGTTYIFTDYLSNVSSDWKSNVGTSKSVQWPVGVGGKGSAGVAAQVRNTSGAIGYVELAYVLQNHMSYALIQNQAGTFVTPNKQTTLAAAAQMTSVSPTHFSMVNAPGAKSYPIAGYTWAFVYQRPHDTARSKALADVMRWVVTDGQVYADALNYVPLPAVIRAHALQGLAKVVTS